MSLDACLPAALRGASTTITPVEAGLSGVGVYHVEAAGQTFVLKIGREAQPPEDWQRRLHIQQLAANEHARDGGGYLGASETVWAVLCSRTSSRRQSSLPATC